MNPPAPNSTAPPPGRAGGEPGAAHADVIVACATPLAGDGADAGARALVRLSGPRVFEALGALLERPCPRTRGVSLARLRLEAFEHPRSPDPARDDPAIDDPALTLPCILLAYPGPGSYTGEDAAELVIPAGPAIVSRVLGSLSRFARPAGPGEFTARAYLAGRLTLEQAEGVAAMIAAQTGAQHDAARALLEGRTGARYRAMAEELSTLLALVEAGIDFTDQEDVVAIEPEALRTRLGALGAELRTLVRAGAGREQAGSRPSVVLAGLPNAGKSTLFNALLGRDRAVVSPVAGTTRDVLREALNVSDNPLAPRVCTLCDLAGLEAVVAPSAPRGAGPASIDAQMQRHARSAIADADVILWCDPTGRFEHAAARGEPAPFTPPAQARIIRVRTKADLARVGETAPAPTPTGSAGARHASHLAVCALDHWNLGALRRAIADAAFDAGAPPGAGESPASALRALAPRHARALEAALEQIDGAIGALGAPGPARPELIAARLRPALDELGELTGRSGLSPDDVIGRIFATFCIGK